MRNFSSLLQVIAKGFGGSVVEVAFICGDSILVTGSQDGVVRLWDLNKQPSDQSGQTDIPGNRMVSKPTRVFGETEDLTILGLRLVGPNRLVAVYADHTSRK